MTTITHHPTDEILLAYAAGASNEGTALVVATHLALCPVCRRTVAKAEAAGGALLEAAEPASVKPDLLDDVLARLDDPVPLPKTLKSAPAGHRAVPEPLRSYIGGGLDGIRWTDLPGGISVKSLMKTPDARVQLIRSKPGCDAGLHTHRGEELTLILTGGYTDVTGHYLSLIHI